MSFDPALANSSAAPAVAAASPPTLNAVAPSSTEPAVSASCDRSQLSAEQPPAVDPEAALQARRVEHTSALLRLLHSFSPWNMRSCVSAVACLLRAGVDSGDPSALLDMSLLDSESDPPQLPALYSVLRFYTSMGSFCADSAERRAEKTEAQGKFVDSCRPLTGAMLRSYPGVASFRMPQSGNSLVAELLLMSLPSAPTAWICSLVRDMCAAGVPVHARNAAGRTALLTAAHGTGAIHTRAIFVSVLADCGADLNEQDAQGDGLLHALVQRPTAELLTDLFSLPLAASIDLHLHNERGLTAAELATQLLLEQWHADRAAVARVMDAAMVRWVSEVRVPVLALLCDSAVEGGEALIPDLAQLVLSYVDNSGRPFPKRITEEQETEAASASAAPEQA